MTISLHTGVRTATASSDWTARDIPFRLVVTDHWAMHRARLLVQEHVGDLLERLGPDRSLLATTPAGTRPPRPFPYGITAATEGAQVHRPAPPPWQQAFAVAARGRAGWQVEPGPSLGARLVQRCAELVAEATSCGVLVAFGDDVATSGLAPVGGWRVEFRESADAGTTVVAVDGGALSTVSAVRPGGRLQPFRTASGRTVLPAWRSVAVAAADAPSADAACRGTLLRGTAAPAWLAGLGLPARLVDADGTAQTVGRWPAPTGS